MLWGCSSVGERLLCKQEVTGSNPVSSTKDSKASAWIYLGLRLVDAVDAISVIAASPYTITSLVNWTAYHVEVQARNSLQPLATHW